MATTVANVLIQLPTSVVDDLIPENLDLFEEFLGDTYLSLYCQPSEYKPITTDLGDVGEDGLIVGYASTFVAVSARLEGFEITTAESRREVMQVLRATQAAVQTVPGNYSPITVYDGHYLTGGHTVGSINGSYYAERFMRLVSLTPLGGSLQRGLETFSMGFTVRFIDVTPRI